MNNFIIFNGEVAQYHPRASFYSDPLILFKWLNPSVFDKDRRSEQPFLIINAVQPDIELYYKFDSEGKMNILLERK